MQPGQAAAGRFGDGGLKIATRVGGVARGELHAGSGDSDGEPVDHIFVLARQLDGVPAGLLRFV